MKLKSNIKIEKIDILMYHGIYDLAKKRIKRLDDGPIPSFIIEESLLYFCELEKYEMCQKIKVFFQNNPKFTMTFSREEWYGITVQKKQKS